MDPILQWSFFSPKWVILKLRGVACSAEHGEVYGDALRPDMLWFLSF